LRAAAAAESSAFCDSTEAARAAAPACKPANGASGGECGASFLPSRVEMSGRGRAGV
jgi:hypothetical protein